MIGLVNIKFLIQLIPRISRSTLRDVYRGCREITTIASQKQELNVIDILLMTVLSIYTVKNIHTRVQWKLNMPLSCVCNVNISRRIAN